MTIAGSSTYDLGFDVRPWGSLHRNPEQKHLPHLESVKAKPIRIRINPSVRIKRSAAVNGCLYPSLNLTLPVSAAHVQQMLRRNLKSLSSSGVMQDVDGEPGPAAEVDVSQQSGSESR